MKGEQIRNSFPRKTGHLYKTRQKGRREEKETAGEEVRRDCQVVTLGPWVCEYCGKKSWEGGEQGKRGRYRKNVSVANVRRRRRQLQMRTVISPKKS